MTKVVSDDTKQLMKTLKKSEIYFVEKEVEELIIKLNKKEYNIKDYIKTNFNLTNNILEASVILTGNEIDSKTKLDEIIELYEFLIEDDYKPWRTNKIYNKLFLSF
ncbi:MAG: hypothetical protein ACRC57_00890 [Sarcina sp.]